MSAPIGPYSPAYRAGEYLFCSGQLGLNGDDLAQGLTGQTSQALVNVKKLLEDHGMTMQNVVKTTVYLTNMGDFPVMNDIYAEHFGGHRPARSTIGVAALPKGAVVEIEVTAHA